MQPDSAAPESLLYSWLTVPRFNVPRWLLEGSAVFAETWMGGGLGRAQGGYDEMVFRAMVRDGVPFYDPLGLASRGVRVDFQVGANAYLYGTRFITWLALQHSPQKLEQWWRRDEGSARHYADAFAQVFGLPLDAAWQQWIAFEQDFQRRNLQAVRQVPLTPMRPLVARALGSSSRTFLDEASGTLYGAFRQQGIVEYIGALKLSDGSVQRLADIKGGQLYSVTSLAFDAQGRRLFYAADNASWRDLMSLDLATGRETMLQKDARIGELAFNPADRALYGVRHNNGFAILVRIAPPYERWEPLHTFDFGVVPTELSVSPDGKLLSASVAEVGGDNFLRVWSLPALLEKGEKGLEAVAQFGFGQAVPEGFVFSPDGRFLFGSSYFTGVSNLFRLELATQATEAVSNAEIGLFRPVPRADGSLLALAYTGQGFVPVALDPKPLKDVSAIRFLGTELVKAHPVLQTWQVPPLDQLDDDGQAKPRGPYHPLRELSLANAYPVLQGYKDSAALGYRASFLDSLGYAGVDVVAGYTPGSSLNPQERAHLDIKGRYLGYTAGLSWNRADFYDLFGPTKRSRKGLALKFGYEEALIYEPPQRLDARFRLAHYSGIDTLPTDQNVSSGFSQLSTAEAGLHYADLRRSLGAVDDEKGVHASAVLSAAAAPGINAQLGRATLDLGTAVGADHGSIWSRTAIGSAAGGGGSSLGRVYFGGFGNNRVDNGPPQRFREAESLPGFGIDEISGRSYLRQQVEVNLPPVVFESIGSPGLHLTWLRPAVFATALWTDADRPALRQRYGSVGAQADLRISVLHWYEMILSIGYGAGYRGRDSAGREWMVSLIIM